MSKNDASNEKKDTALVDNDINDDGADDARGSGPVVMPRPENCTIDVHPLVLLSVVDHFARINSKVASKRRVAGLLLGSYIKKASGETTLDINNCFAVPFDEDAKSTDVWFLDTNYAEDMFLMFRKVLPKVRVIGWYSSGPTIQSNDLQIHLQIADRFCPNPVYCIVNTDPNNKGVPVLAYTTTEGREGSDIEFRNVVTNLGALEAEEIGIEHLLRDLTDSTITTLSTKVGDRQLSLVRLEQILGSIETYLLDVADGKLPVSHDILSSLQEIVNLQPLLHQTKMSQGMLTATNDQALCTFVASLTRCVMGINEAILNRRKLARELREIDEKREAKRKSDKEKIEAEVAKKKEERKAKAAEDHAKK